MKENPNIMKILSIGNSFSQDAQAYLHKFDPDNVYCVNLYIPGCSLERHWDNAASDKAAYLRQENGQESDSYVSIKSTLTETDWNFVTLQQASHDSGILESYFPYIHKLSDYVKKISPKSQQILHETWAYEADSDHEAFSRYHKNQQEMYQKLEEAYTNVAARLGLQMIPVGTVIQALRKQAFFEKRPLTRDGYHLSLDYGRYAAALTWYETLVASAEKISFQPENTSPEVIQMIKGTVKQIVKETKR